MTAPGIEIIEKEENSTSRTFRFRIVREQKEDALCSLKAYIDEGFTITVSDNRENRNGALSFRCDAGNYFKSGGGHGFSVPWTLVTTKDLLWLLKVTAQYNFEPDGLAEGEMNL